MMLVGALSEVLTGITRHSIEEPQKTHQNVQFLNILPGKLDMLLKIQVLQVSYVTSQS